MIQWTGQDGNGQKVFNSLLKVVQEWNKQIFRHAMEDLNSAENQNLAVANLEQCYSYKRQLAEKELNWRSSLSILFHP
jgi:hypothetical protein